MRRWVNFLPFAFWCYLAFNLFNLQILKHQSYSIRAKNQHEQKVRLVARRGNIYDRNGRPLAVSIKAYSIYAVTKYVRNLNQTAMKLAQLGLGPYRELVRKLKTKRFFWVKMKVDKELATKVKELHLPGIGVVDDYLRFYPQKRYLKDLIGNVSSDNRGLSGLEFQFDSILKGRDGFAVFQKKPSGRGYPYPHYPMLEPECGGDLYLTLDLDLQILLYETLSRAVDRYRADRAAGVIIEPGTGKVLALVNINGDRCHNSVISDEFEPGSTFKIVTLAAALIEGHRLDEIVDVSGGRLKVGGHLIHDFRDYGRLDLKGVFVHSSNVGAVKIGRRVRREIFFQTARALGFGNLTGIHLPGEAKGKIYRPREMKRLRYANNCFGQGVTVTLLQLTNAYAAIAASGKLYRPYVVARIVGGETRYTFRPFLIRRSLTPEICHQISEVLAAVVEEGTGRRARNRLIKICGKTGTAQKAGPGGYLPGRIITTFVGYFPKQEPDYVIGIMLDEPKQGSWASQITAPVFGEIVAGMAKIPGMVGDSYAYAQ
ncbi:hypothetical protein DRP53_05645 [candidate division WOR-3 bacterium]|uniref:Penicillin-binding protein 2 n=1 Tax=candidate division WOR-3 bacterium TaxID=2052148 RepID=A0A660SHR4_UNCW3|nr:MAG: hypothetical protein DRP53_05645 [candidate division WOR-3 bacterium]